MPGTAPLRRFLEQIALPGRPRIDASDLAVVVAHPDDETIGCGFLLTRVEGARVIVITDGAPRNLQDAQAHGFASTAEYAAARRLELQAALKIAGVAPDEISHIDIPDQEAAYRLPHIASRLTSAFRDFGIRLAITHAYEGGHPDHDATAFCVHRAFRQLPCLGEIIEMPLYRAEGSGDARQSFVPVAGHSATVIELTPAEQELKGRMVAAHATQRNVLSGFSLAREQFRAAPNYDFTQLPNGGRVLYDRENWRIDSARWIQCVRAALAEERVPACA